MKPVYAFNTVMTTQPPAPNSQRKLSEVLLEFAQPLLGERPTKHRFHSVMKHVILVWNMGLLPAERQKELWVQLEVELKKGLPQAIVPEYVRELRAWFRWRLSHYGSDQRLISHYKLKETNGQARLAVYFSDRMKGGF